MSAPLYAVAAAQGGVFSATDAIAHGYHSNEIARLVARGEWQRLRHGVLAFADPTPPSDVRAAHRQLVRAAQLRVSDAPANHLSAAMLLGAAMLRPAAGVTLTSATSDHRKRPGLHVLRAPLRTHDRGQDAHGVPVTSGARTAIDCGRTLPFLDAVVILDSLLHQGLTTSELIEDSLAVSRQWRGSRAAARAAAFADGRSESPGESWTRVLMAELGLPRPEPQLVMRGESGAEYRGDLVVPEHRTIVEFDGKVKYDEADTEAVKRALRAEKRREDDLRAMGWFFARIEWPDLYRPEVVRRKIEHAFASAALWRAA